MSKELKLLLVIGGAFGALVIGMWAAFPYLSGTSTVAAGETVLIRTNSNQTSPMAKVKVVEFGDYQCPSCAVAQGNLKRLVAEYGDQIDLVFRHFPLLQHANALIAAEAAEAAGAQGKFWQMHDLLYERQSAWESESNPTGRFVDYAKEIGLDLGKFRKDVENYVYSEKINQDKADGQALHLQGTPTIFIDGVQESTFSYSQLKSDIDKALI